MDEELGFAEKVDAVLAAENPPLGVVKVLENTPDILKKCGLKDEPFYYTTYHLKAAVADFDDEGHCHGLDPDIIKRLPELLAEPIAICDSPRDKTLFMILDEDDKLEQPILLAFHVGGRVSTDDRDVNFITSVYGKRPLGFRNMIRSAANENRLLFLDSAKFEWLISKLDIDMPSNYKYIKKDQIIHKTKAYKEKPKDNVISFSSAKAEHDAIEM